MEETAEVTPIVDTQVKKSKKRIKVMVAINTLTSVQAAPYRDHMMLAYRLGRDFRNIDFGQMVGYRQSIDRFRNTAAKTAILQGFDYIFFIDDDMLFQDPSNVFGPLYKAKMDIIAAFNYIRGYPFEIMAFKDIPKDGQHHLVYLTQEDIAPDSPRMRADGVCKCEAIGTAVCLIKVDLLKLIPGPWFLTGPRNTEDIYLCCRAHEVKPNVKIGMHTKVITGHILDPEVISHHTRDHLRSYQESYMTPEEITQWNRSQLESGDRGEKYVEEEINPILPELGDPSGSD